MVTGTYGSMNTATGSATKDGVVTEALGVNLSAEVLNSDGYQMTPAQYSSAFPGKGRTSATIVNARIAAYFTPR